MKNLRFKTRIIGVVVIVAIFASSNVYAQRAQRLLRQQPNQDTRLHQNFRSDRMYNQRNLQGRMYFQDRAGRGMGLLGLNLTEEQSEQINTLRAKHLKELLTIKNEMLENRARLRTLTTTEEFNKKEIDKLIDEVTLANAKQMKQRIAHQQEIRSLLSEEQRIIFDSSNRGYGQGYGQGNFSRRNGRSGNRTMRPGFGFRAR